MKKNASPFVLVFTGLALCALASPARAHSSADKSCLILAAVNVGCQDFDAEEARAVVVQCNAFVAASSLACQKEVEALAACVQNVTCAEVEDTCGLQSGITRITCPGWETFLEDETQQQDPDAPDADGEQSQGEPTA